MHASQRMQISDLMLFLNTYQRYESPKPLSPEFVTLAKDLIGQYLDQETHFGDKKPRHHHSLTNLELYRLISASLFYSDQLPVDLITNKLLTQLLARTPTEQTRKEETIRYMKCVSSIIGRIRLLKVKIDISLLKQMKALVVPNKYEKKDSQ